MLRILLIEDEFIIAKDLKIQLSKNNFAKVDIAEKHNSALKLYLEHSYDLIISDINLHDQKDGIDIINELSKIKKIPVVYLTAYSDISIIKRAEKTLPFAYILKPYNNNQLRATINLAILNAKKAENGHDEDPKNNDKIALLTKREREILVTLSTGKKSQEIANILNISANTVEQHKKNIKKKLELKTIGELVNFTLSTKLLKI